MRYKCKSSIVPLLTICYSRSRAPTCVLLQKCRLWHDTTIAQESRDSIDHQSMKLQYRRKKKTNCFSFKRWFFVSLGDAGLLRPNLLGCLTTILAWFMYAQRREIRYYIKFQKWNAQLFIVTMIHWLVWPAKSSSIRHRKWSCLLAPTAIIILGLLRWHLAYRSLYFLQLNGLLPCV